MNAIFAAFSLTPIVGAGFGETLIGWVNQFIELLFRFTQMIGLPSYALAILLLTLIFKLITQPLNVKQSHSMRQMQLLQPQLDEIKRRYPNDKQKQSEQTMALYRKEGVKPLAGCLPLLIQLPIMILLYNAVRQFVPLYPEYDGLLTQWFPEWLPSLSATDTTVVMPLLVAVTTFLQQWVNSPKKAELNQKVMLYAFPVMFFFFAQSFPAGLCLYWIGYSVFGTLIHLPFKIKWQREDERIRAEQERKRLEEEEKKRARKEAYQKAKKRAKSEDNPIYEVQEDDFSDLIAEEEAELRAQREKEEAARRAERAEWEVPLIGESYEDWLQRIGVTTRTKKVKVHPYSPAEEVVTAYFQEDGKETTEQRLRLQYEDTRPRSEEEKKRYEKQREPKFFNFGKGKKDKPDEAPTQDGVQSDEPRAGEDFYEWLLRVGIKVEKRGVKLRPYDSQETQVDCGVYADGHYEELAVIKDDFLKRRYRVEMGSPKSKEKHKDKHKDQETAKGKDQ